MSDRSIVGIQPCGCVTFIDTRPTDPMDRASQKSLNRIISRGGEVKSMPFEEAKALPDFMPFECPHDPKGWGTDE